MHSGLVRKKVLVPTQEDVGLSRKETANSGLCSLRCSPRTFLREEKISARIISLQIENQTWDVQAGFLTTTPHSYIPSGVTVGWQSS
jgi:hypothetical protein